MEPCRGSDSGSTPGPGATEIKARLRTIKQKFFYKYIYMYKNIYIYFI